jgi:cytidylate kinase
MKKYVQIAIDGPVGAGKGTVARELAKRTGFAYIDTGAMYRAVALMANRNGVSWYDEKSVAKVVSKLKIELRSPEGEENDGRLVTVMMNGEDISWKIRTEEISRGSSAVATLPKVRKKMVGKQQQMSKCQNVIMEGRDVTNVVLPNAQLKIYLTASLKERARRRYKQLKEQGKKVEYQKVFSDVKDRDKQDSGRKVDPLAIAKDAWVLDTTKMSVDEVVSEIQKKMRSLIING